MEKNNKMIHLGSCARPHGIAGGFSVALFNKQDSAVKKGTKLLLRPKGPSSSLPIEGREVVVTKASLGNKAILFFEGVSNRNEVEAVIPFDIYIDRALLPEPDEGEFYLEDLIGLTVLDPDGNKIGCVQTYFDNGAQTVLVVKKTKGKIELPFVEAFFPELDLEARTITMNEPEII